MSVFLLVAALLPAIFLWYYIWKQDPQPEPTSWLVKEGNGLSVAISRALFAVPGHYVFAVLMGSTILSITLWTILLVLLLVFCWFQYLPMEFMMPLLRVVW